MSARDWAVVFAVFGGVSAAIFAGTLLFIWLIDTSPIGRCYGEPRPGCPWYDGGVK